MNGFLVITSPRVPEMEPTYLVPTSTIFIVKYVLFVKVFFDIFFHWWPKTTKLLRICLHKFNTLGLHNSIQFLHLIVFEIFSDWKLVIRTSRPGEVQGIS